MGVSQGNFSSGPEGLTLKAWGVFDAAATLIQGYNMATGTNLAVGMKRVNFVAAMANTNYQVVIKSAGGSIALGFTNVSAKTTANMTITLKDSTGAANDPDTFHVAVYG